MVALWGSRLGQKRRSEVGSGTDSLKSTMSMYFCTVFLSLFSSVEISETF
jgi:hypothetical protein